MKIIQNENKKATIISIILLSVVAISVILAIFFFASSNKTAKKGQLGEQSGNDAYYRPTEEEKAREAELENILKNNLPQMDGIVSTIPLEAGISVKLFGKSQETVEAGIIHTDAEKAYSNLLSGKCDIIFTSTFTDKQEREAASKNIAVKIEKIAAEGIVFVVNADNPVETLSQQQIKDIYSGKIKNWNEVGGYDAEIVVFQNKEGSEAQEFMKNFMADETLIEPAKEFFKQDNSGIVEKIATYDNSENAIGYMVYKYPANVYQGNDNIKFIKIDGVEATKKNMTSKEYPLIREIYAIYNNTKVATKTSDELAEWLLTYEGQKSIAEAGYIPVKNIETTENNIERYVAEGTRGEQAELGNFYYKVNSQDYNVIGQNALIVGIQGLKDQELQKKINEFISESRENLQSKEIEYEKYVILKANCTKEGITVKTECKNGYLSVQILLTYKVGSNQYIYDGYSKVYDLYTGEELTLSDLYYNGVEFISILNEQIKTIIKEKTGIDETYLREKRPFVGITNNVIYGLETIAFTKENPYFEESVEFELDTYFDNISIINEERDMKDIWEDNIKVSKEIVMHDGKDNSLRHGKVSIKETQNCIYTLFYMKTDYSETDEEMNENIDKYAKDKEIRQLLQKASDAGAEFVMSSNNKYQITIYVTIMGKEYAIMNITANTKQGEANLGSMTVDLETGEKKTKNDIQQWKQENGVQ